jgi:hypothetical protein
MNLRIALIVLAVVVALTLAAYVRGGFPYEVYRTSRQIVALGSDAHGIYWLEGEADSKTGADTVCVLDGGRGSARRLGTQPGLAAVASSGEALVALQREGEGGAVLVIPRSGAAPVTLAQGLSHPNCIAVYDGAAYWTETFPPLVPHARHIPASQARATLRSVALSGQAAPRSVACLDGEMAEFAGELLGGADGRFHLLEVVGLEYGVGWSSLRSVPIDGGTAETLVRERGRQTGLLAGSTLYWTAFSQDAGEPMLVRSLWRGRLPQATPEALTDWLPPNGTLCELDGRVYYGSGYEVWRVPDRLALPRLVAKGMVGRRLVTGYQGAVYSVTVADKVCRVLRGPQTLGARLRAGIRIR